MSLLTELAVFNPAIYKYAAPPELQNCAMPQLAQFFKV